MHNFKWLISKTGNLTFFFYQFFMKLKAICTICLLIISASIFAQIQFEKTITSSFVGSVGNSVVQTTDEGYIGLGDCLVLE